MLLVFLFIHTADATVAPQNRREGSTLDWCASVASALNCRADENGMERMKQVCFIPFIPLAVCAGLRFQRRLADACVPASAMMISTRRFI